MNSETNSARLRLALLLDGAARKGMILGSARKLATRCVHSRGRPISSGPSQGWDGQRGCGDAARSAQPMAAAAPTSLPCCCKGEKGLRGSRVLYRGIAWLRRPDGLGGRSGHKVERVLVLGRRFQGPSQKNACYGGSPFIHTSCRQGTGRLY